jgi:hypothetical protein
MAVKPITNKQIVSSANINRGDQVSSKDTTVRGGNRSESVVPGNNYSENYAITLKDVDTSILSHVKTILRPKVKEANEMVDVKVLYGNEERWSSVRKNGVMRDKNGSILLPLIMLKRTTITKNILSTQGFEHDVKQKYVEVVRNNQWSKTNRYDRFSVQQGLKPSYESILTGMPNFADITYEFILWTNFIEQMNPLVEMFIGQSNTYWGDGTDMKFLCKIDNITDASEMSQDGERFIKTTFSIVTNAYLLPEYLNSVVTGKISNLKKKLSPSKVVFGFEGDATNKQVGK